MKGDAVSDRGRRRRRAIAVGNVTELARDILDVDPSGVFASAAEHMVEWRGPGPDGPVQRALVHIHTCGCGRRDPKKPQCALARAIVVLIMGALAVGSGPNTKLLRDISLNVARDMERMIKRRLAPYWPDKLTPQQLQLLQTLQKQQEPGAREVRRVGRRFIDLNIACESLRDLAQRIVSEVESRALSPEEMRASKKHRPALATAEAALRAGRFSDELIARMLLDTRSGQTSTPVARVVTRSRTPRQIPKVLRGKIMRGRVVLINDDE